MAENFSFVSNCKFFYVGLTCYFNYFVFYMYMGRGPQIGFLDVAFVPS